MPRRKQIRPKRMKYSDDGKEEVDDDPPEDGDEEEEDEEDSKQDPLLPSDAEGEAPMEEDGGDATTSPANDNDLGKELAAGQTQLHADLAEPSKEYPHEEFRTIREDSRCSVGSGEKDDSVKKGVTRRHSDEDGEVEDEEEDEEELPHKSAARIFGEDPKGRSSSTEVAQSGEAAPMFEGRAVSTPAPLDQPPLSPDKAAATAAVALEKQPVSVEKVDHKHLYVKHIKRGMMSKVREEQNKVMMGSGSTLASTSSSSSSISSSKHQQGSHNKHKMDSSHNTHDAFPIGRMIRLSDFDRLKPQAWRMENRDVAGRRSPPPSASSLDKTYQPLKAVQDMVKAAERSSPLMNSFAKSDLPLPFRGLSTLGVPPSSSHFSPGQRSMHTGLVVSSSESGSRESSMLKPSAAPKGDAQSPMFKYLSPDAGEPDQPLDLSLKPKKGVSSPGMNGARSCSSSSGGIYTSPLLPSALATTTTTTPSLTSSLASLEKKFGENSAMFDRIGNKHTQQPAPMRHFYLSAFGVGLYSTALNNTQQPHPSPYSQPLHSSIPKSSTCIASSTTCPITTSPSVKSSVVELPTPTKQRPQSSASSPCSCAAKSRVGTPDTPKSQQLPKFVEQVNAAVASAVGVAIPHGEVPLGSATSPGTSPGEGKKHTNLLCSCRAEFGTLYQLTIHLQETGHPPQTVKNNSHQEYPKLVRGQDMWLNQGSEQTRQILRCMQCGESFKSLPELTVHMIQTKHYTNIVGTDSPQQPNSSDNNNGSGCGDNNHLNSKPKFLPMSPRSNSTHGDTNGGDGAEPPLLHGFKCLMCSETFRDVPSLAEHMDKAGHNTLEDVKPPPHYSPQTLDKSLTGGSTGMDGKHHHKRRMLESLNLHKVEEHSIKAAYESGSDSNHAFPVTEASRIRCENCSEKIDTKKFVEHVRLCVRTKKEEEAESASGSDSERAQLSSMSRSVSPLIKYNKYNNYMNGEIKVKVEREEMDRQSVEPDSSLTPTKSPAQSSSEFVSAPSDAPSGGCALKAMESFIETFTGSSGRKGPTQSAFFGGTHPLRRNMFGEDRASRFGLGTMTPQSPVCQLNSAATTTVSVSRPSSDCNSSRPKDPEGMSGFLYQNKYLPPLYGATSNSTSPPANANFSATLKQDPKVAVDEIQKTQSKENGKDLSLPKRNRDQKEKENVEQCKKKEASLAESGKESPRRTNLQEKYLNYAPPSAESPAVPVENSKPPAVQAPAPAVAPAPASASSASSALESLQGLVYGKSFNTEHPLDSLQKLIHSTNNNSINHSSPQLSKTLGSPCMMTSASSALHQGGGGIQTTIPGAVILVNPIVTVMPNCTGGSPTVQISLPPPPSRHQDNVSPASSAKDGSQRSLSPLDRRSPMSEHSDSDQPGEYRCLACKRNFASKGSYRYHLSRCHVSKFGAGIKDAINTSPYVYLPLDHSAKFNKYYEMANELANKSK